MGGIGFALGLLGLLTGETLECVRNEKIRSYQPTFTSPRDKLAENLKAKKESCIDCCYYHYLQCYGDSIILCPREEYEKMFVDMCNHTNYIESAYYKNGECTSTELEYYRKYYNEAYQKYFYHRMPFYHDKRVQLFLLQNEYLILGLKRCIYEKELNSPPSYYDADKHKYININEPFDCDYYKQMVKHFNPWYEFYDDNPSKYDIEDEDYEDGS